jgi:hypothetical protein
LVHFFSAEGWQTWGLGGQPLIPELQRLRRELGTFSRTFPAPVPDQEQGDDAKDVVPLPRR